MKAEANGQVRTSEVQGLRVRGNATLLLSDDGQEVHLMGTRPAQMITIFNDFISLPDSQEDTHASLAAGATRNKIEVPPGPQGREVEGEPHKKRKPRKKLPWWAVTLIVVGGLFVITFMLMMLYTIM